MKIGDLDLGHKLMLAPMAEVTDESFRRIAKKYGVGLTFTQMVSAEGVIDNNFKTLRLLAFNPNEKPIGVQILGREPSIIGAAVGEISKLKPDLIDINFGCPVNSVCQHDMGASLLNKPRQIAQIIRSMADNSNGIPVSAKLRLGKNIAGINILENAKIIEDNGASLIILHARTRADKYDTQADWSWIEKVKKNVNIPVTGNGSVFTPQDASAMINQTGCDSVMIARGALGNPFLYSRFNSLVESNSDPGEPPVEEVLSVVMEHIKLLSKEYPESKAVDKAKKNIIWYYMRFKGIEELLSEIFGITSIEALKDFVIVHTDKINRGFFHMDKREEIFTRFNRKVSFWLEQNFKNIFYEMN